MSLIRVLLIMAIGVATVSVVRAEVLYSWVQYGGPTGALVRTISSDPVCPVVYVNDIATTMQKRVKTPPKNFREVYVCDLFLESTITSLRVGDQPLPVPTKSLQNVAVLGDTGCRVTLTTLQNCTGKGPGLAWDYAGVAQAAADAKPDLVIHVGDYHYREITTHCGKSCLSKNIGKNWDSWEADFFSPSGDLLLAAPWVMIRGNHEDCTRAWEGWFYLLDPNPIGMKEFPDECPVEEDSNERSWNYTEPYMLEFAQTRLMVMDSSYLKYSLGHIDQPTVDQYAAEFDRLAELIGDDKRPVWLLTHRPFWGLTRRSKSEVDAFDKTLELALHQSKNGKLPAAVSLIISGHIHLLQSLPFRDGRPQQLVFGASGTKLDPDLGDEKGLFENVRVALGQIGVDPASFYWSNQFNFGMIRQDSTNWHVSVIAKDGSILKKIDIVK